MMCGRLRFFWWVLLLALGTGCATSRIQPPTQSRSFQFGVDTFAFENQLHWEYGYDQQGRWRAIDRDPPPEFAHRCFVLAEVARKFYYHAVFDPERPPLSSEEYRALIRATLSRSARTKQPNPIRIPGYANFHDFSEAHESLLKKECGGAWQSYWQRGNWRMIFPFTRRGQLKMARQFEAKSNQGDAPIAHLVTFPSLRLNHAILIYAAERRPGALVFHCYDPNEARAPVQLTFDLKQRRFHFPAARYFPGGPVNAYEVYTGCCY